MREGEPLPYNVYHYFSVGEDIILPYWHKCYFIWERGIPPSADGG